MLLRRARLAVAALVTAGGVLWVAQAPASAAAPGDSSTLLLVGQSATVTPSSPGNPVSFTLDVRVAGPSPAGAAIELTFYDRLRSRGEFEQSLTGSPVGVLQRIASEPLSSLRSVDGAAQLTETVGPGASPAAVTLPCQVGNETCSGVYPVVAQLVSADGTVLSHFTTFLTYAEGKSSRPVVFSWIAPFASPIRLRSTGVLGAAIRSLSASRVADLENLVTTLAGNPTEQVSVAASPATVEALQSDNSSKARGALTALRAFASANPHRLVMQPYVPVNLAALSEAGVTTEIEGQSQRAQDVMDSPAVLGGLPPADQPSASKVWVAQGSVGPSIASGLSELGAQGLVLPDSALPTATEEFHATWAQPFELSVDRTEITAAASDSQLSSYFTADPRDPALAANHLLADLAMIQSELPNAPNPRGVIAIPPVSWDPNPQFVDTLVSGLANNPVVTTATLDQFFTPGVVPVGGNGAVATRHLIGGSISGAFSASQAAGLALARNQITGFLRSVQPGHPQVENELEDLLLASESSELSPSAQKAGVAAFERRLAAELNGIKVVESTVTLTSRTASVPVTITSSVGYNLRATLTLSSGKLQFPQGAIRKVNIDHPTNTTDVEVRARTTGDLPLSFTLTSPDGRLLIARGRMTVRSTATSIVGIVLTLVAAVVLLGWWARTWRRGRRQRTQRPARGGQ